MIYSYSSISCFENCPRAFQFKYVDRVKVEVFQTIESFTGSLIHDVLRKFYEDRISGVEIDLNGVLGYYLSSWNQKISLEIVVNKEGLTAEDYKVLGEKCLIDYYNRYGSFDESDIFGAEVRVFLDLLGDGRYKMVGYIDRVDKKSGGGIRDP